MTKEEAAQFAVQMDDQKNFYEQQVIRMQLQITQLEARIALLEKSGPGKSAKK